MHYTYDPADDAGDDKLHRIRDDEAAAQAMQRAPWMGVTVYLVTATGQRFGAFTDLADASGDWEVLVDDGATDARIWEWQAGQVPVDVTPKVPA